MQRVPHLAVALGGLDLAATETVVGRALDLGVTFFDTAEMYGPYTNEELLGQTLAEAERWARDAADAVIAAAD